jgi:iron complex outermembrane receptor protein
VSVTALNERMLNDAGVNRLDDIQGLAPNLQISTARSNADAVIQIRGIGTTTGEIPFDPGVGVYVDGVFMPRSLGGLVDVLDIQQIEVLRGPQGTLFGKNTVGGALVITTNKPHDEFEGSVRIRAGNYDQVDTRVMLNLPLGRGTWEDKILGRFAFGTSYNDGYVNNVVRHENWSDRDSFSFLGTVRLLPIENVTVDLSGTYSRSHSRPLGGECFVVLERELTLPLPDGSGSITLPVDSPLLYPGYYDDCRKSRPFDVRSNSWSLVDIQSYGFWGTVEWSPGTLGVLEDVVLKSITGWREQRPRVSNDIDSTSLTVLNLAAIGGSSPRDGDPIFQQQITQELQLNANALNDRIKFVSGLFAFWEDATANLVTYSDAATFSFANQSGTETDNWNWALYTQATAELRDWLSITTGLRYTQEKKGISVFNQNFEPDENVTLDDDGRKIYDAWTPMASIAFRAPESVLEDFHQEHMMAYFSYSRGFRGGGFNGVVNPFTTEGDTIEKFKPEYLDSFEIGLKTVGFDRRLTTSLALFYGDYSDIQVNSTRVVGDPNSATDRRIQRITQNAAEATIGGVEFEMLALPFHDLQVAGSIGYLETEYDDFGKGCVGDLELDEGKNCAADDIFGLPTDRTGESFNGVPELQSRLALQYPISIEHDGPAWLTGVLTPQVDWTYRSKIHYAGPEVIGAVSRGLNLLNMRLAFDFNDSLSQVALWTKNLTDESHFGFAFSASPLFGTGSRYYQPPRTYGGEISHKF